METPQLVVPYSLTNNDAKFSAGGVGTSDDFFAFCKHAIDQLREEAAEPNGVGRMMSIGLQAMPVSLCLCVSGLIDRMMSTGLHQRLMGHPARARAVGMLLDYCATCPDVWVTSRRSIANHWREHFPPAPPAPVSHPGAGGRPVPSGAASSDGASGPTAGLSKFAMAEARAMPSTAEAEAAEQFGGTAHQDEIRVQLDDHVVRVTPLALSSLPYTDQLAPDFGAVVRCDLNAVVENPQAFEAVRAALHEYGLLVFRQQSVHPSALALFTHKFDEASPSVWRDLSKNPWEIFKAKDGPSGDFMIPGELMIDSLCLRLRL